MINVPNHSSNTDAHTNSPALLSETTQVLAGKSQVIQAPRRLCTVVSTGLALALIDREHRCAGLAHLIPEPLIEMGQQEPFADTRLIGSTTQLITPIETTLKHLLDGLQMMGASSMDLTACIAGAAEMSTSPKASRFPRFVLLAVQKTGIPVHRTETGGKYARRMTIHSETGQVDISNYT